MFDLSTTIVHHDLYRVIPCCLCGAEWEEQWVSVALLIQGKGTLGDLCPRCLVTTPKSRAHRLHELGQRLGNFTAQVQEYLTHNLHFQLGSAERSGLKLFAQLAHSAGLAPERIELAYRTRDDEHTHDERHTPALPPADEPRPRRVVAAR